MKIKPFKGIRPQTEAAAEVASYPYDIFSRNKYRELAESEDSFLHVIRSDIDLPDTVCEHDKSVYASAALQLDRMIQNGVLKTESRDCLYIYQEEMDGRIQTGVVCSFPTAAYEKGTVKRHELTLEEKVRDRQNHMKATKVQTGAVFLAYKEEKAISEFISRFISENAPVYNFKFVNETIQKLWVVNKSEGIKEIVRLVSGIDSFYIIDGHHRMEAAKQLAKKNSDKKLYQYMMGVLFPSVQLCNMANNRVIHTKNGMTDNEILNKISDRCIIERSDAPYIPDKKGRVGLYMGAKWYKLKLNNVEKGKPDSAILQDTVLAPVFGIENPSLDSNFESVGWIHGIAALIEKTERSDGVAFTMYPSGLDEIMELADRGKVMPPKSTWFEPKILSGLFSRKMK